MEELEEKCYNRKKPCDPAKKCKPTTGRCVDPNGQTWKKWQDEEKEKYFRKKRYSKHIKDVNALKVWGDVHFKHPAKKLACFP